LTRVGAAAGSAALVWPQPPFVESLPRLRRTLDGHRLADTWLPPCKRQRAQSWTSRALPTLSKPSQRWRRDRRQAPPTRSIRVC
jgi:hypothetical protein